MIKKEFADKVKQILPFKAYLSEELRNQLVNLMQSEINPLQPNYWPLIGLGTIVLISLGIMFYLNRIKFPNFKRKIKK